MAEQSKFQTPNLSDSFFSFPPHRRRHLKSETFCTLVRLLSHVNCGDSQYSHSKEVVSAHPQQGSGVNELKQRPEPEVCHEPAGSTVLESKTGLTCREAQILKEVGIAQCFDEDGMEIDESEHVKGTKIGHLENGGICGNTMEDNHPCGNFVSLIGDQEAQFDLLEICMEESEKERQDINKEHPNCDIFESLDMCLDIDIIDEFRKLDHNNAEESSFVESHVLKEVGHEMPIMELEKLGSSSGTMNSELSLTAGGEIEQGEISGDFGINDQSTDLLVEDSLLLEKKVDEEQTSEAIADKEKVKARKAENQEDTKHNKNFGETIVNVCNAVELTLEDSTISAKACNSKMVVDGKVEDAKMAHGYNSELESSRYRKQDIRTSDKINRPAMSGDGLLCYDDVYPAVPGEISGENATGNQGTLATSKKDAVVREKRKRGPLTEEKKEKKKKKKRIKRAETNKRLGVKRLKIQPILKPKTVTYCRHYLRGRCQEGEKCKFSHDTIPLTKSKPCCHFARNSCMKGDDCPYDHDLSKYPCNNFSSKGSCSRGTDCRFSHEVQPVDGSSDTIAQLKVQPVEGSSDTTAQVKSPPLLRSADSEKQLNTQASSDQKGDSKTVSTYKRPPLRKRPQEIVSESVLNLAVQTPKGISKLMFGVPNQAGSFPKADAGPKFGLPLKPNTADITQNSKESRRLTEALESKGINFLSFGKAPLHDSNSKNPSSLALSKDIGVQKTTFCDSSKEKQSAFSLQKNDGLKLGNQSQSTKTPAVGPRGINFLSFGKARSDDSCNTKLVNMPSKGNNNVVVSSVEERASASNGKTNVIMSSVQESESASKLQTPCAEPGGVPSSSSSDQARESGSKLQMPGAKPWKMLSSSLHSVLSLDRTGDEHGKDMPSSSLKALFSCTPNSAQKCNVSSMPNSTQKSLQSMLAFAAKYDSSIKVDTPTVTAESNKASSSSQNTARGSTILDFLNVGGSKTKQ